MKKELKQIIQELAAIQIEAYTRLMANPDSVDQYQLNQLIEFNQDDVIEVLEARIRYWKTVQNLPQLIKGISPYQLGVCTHILFVMEETWVQDNVDGVLALWDLFDELYKKHHPEINLLKWYQPNKSKNI